MWLNTEDCIGRVCINLDTGLRLRPNKSKQAGIDAGVQVIFPDGNTHVDIRADFSTVVNRLQGLINL